MPPPALELRRVCKTYPNGVRGLDEFDLQLAIGERLALLGPTGSGKSTLLRIVQGLEKTDSGEIFLDGKSLAKVPPHLRNVTLLPQRPALYPQLTARQNIEIVTPMGQFQQEMLDILNLGALLDRYPHQLSGGEKQRVALAKILRRGAGLWLLDEPFAALDPEYRSEFRYDLHLLLEASSATIIVVTHDPIDALALGHRIGVLSKGRLLQLGVAEKLQTQPGHRTVAGSFGQFTLIDGRWLEGDGDPSLRERLGLRVFASECGSIRFAIPIDIARSLTESTPRLTFGIKPIDVSPWSPASSPPEIGWVGLRGWTNVLAEPVGSGWLLTVARGRTRLRVEWKSGSPPPVGVTSDWLVNTRRGIWFDGRTGSRLL